MSGLLSRDELVALLTDLGARLAERDQSIEIYVVGGTAMVLAYDRDRLTRDIDAVWQSDPAFDDAVAKVALDRGLPRDWINDRVRTLLPRVLDEGSIEALSLPGITVSVSSPRHMIAMKTRAARDSRDLDDLAALCQREGLTTIEEVLSVSDDLWGPGLLRDETVFVVREGLQERGLRG